MKKIFFTTLLSLAAIIAATAQPNLPAKCIAKLPKVLNNIIISEVEANAVLKSGDYGQSNTIEAYWTAYSDREHNTTYMSPSPTAEKCSELEWNETVRIAKIQGNFALVYTEPNKHEQFPLISADAVCRGWVDMRKLLLWRSCLANDEGIYFKALLCVNLEAGSSATQDFGRGYKAPNSGASKESLTTDMNFYYVMKYENDMALLATQSRMDGKLSDKVLFCWVPKQSYVPWNQRSCLEPTWKHDDVEYFASKKISAIVYEDLKQQKRASTIEYHKKESPTYEQYLYRMKGSDLRYPILDNGTATVYNMSTFSVHGGVAVGTENEAPETKNADDIQKEKLEKMLNINLVIVIDGTDSMAPYYPAVKEAIKSGLEYFSQGYKIKVGIVIYRDYADGEEGLVEMMPLTNVSNGTLLARVNNFLDTGGTYGIKSAKSDMTQTEALYYGMGYALDNMRFAEGESNIMLVVGDCGNTADDTNCPTPEQLVAKIVEKDIHMMGFQVQNKNIVAFNSFNNQLLPIMRNSLANNYKKLDASLQASIRVSARPAKSEAGIDEGYNFTANVDRQLYISSHRFADANVNEGKMDPLLLTEHMTGSIKSFASAVQGQIDLITEGAKKTAKRIATGSKFKGTVAANGMMNIDDAFIASRLGADWAEQLKNSGNVINFSGYVMRQDASGRDFFKPVIFISMEEYDELLKRLAPVAEAAMNSQTKDRTPYIEAMKALVRSLSPGITENDMAKLTNEEITKMIGGLHEAAKSLNSYTIESLSDPIAVPPQKYLSIITDFSRKYKNLSRIRQSRTYKFVKEFNSAKYYWIPIEDLP